MKSFLKHLSVVFWLLLAAAGWGCATSGEENIADRPWNTPKNWEHGLPPGMMEGR